MNLEGKRFLVTGGASGIGRAVVKKLVEKGARGLVMDCNAEKAEALLREVKPSVETPDAILFMYGDLTQSKDIQKATDLVREVYQGLDILVNCAAVTSDATSLPFDQLTDDEWEGHWKVNVLGTVRMCRVARQLMSENSGGNIVNISSVHASIPRNAASYSTTKAAIENLTSKLAIEWGGLGIRVNAVAPGWIRTEGVAWSFADEEAAAEALRSMTALKREGKPEEVAEAVLFLASPLAGYITGTVLRVDGGWLSV
ncbi:MAG: SDR family oxidoreductase [Opitutales bacterium]|nr:SDR family oxidoreductase [Opitutales bacterium]